LLQVIIWIVIILCVIKAIHSLVVVFKANDKNEVAQGVVDTGIGLFVSCILFMFSRIV
jgi:Na+/proline symporter